MSDTGRSGSCKGPVVKHISCVRCVLIFHCSCALKVIGLYVSNTGVIYCDSSEAGRKSTKLTPTVCKNANVSVFVVKLLNKLLEEREMNNKLLMENKAMLVEKVAALKLEVAQLKDPLVNKSYTSVLNYPNYIHKEIESNPIEQFATTSNTYSNKTKLHKSEQ